MTQSVVTRFAPSPTGDLHIGGARTSLFAWSFARRHGGCFILRLEDTDRARSTAAATQRLIADLMWLGLTWDEGPTPDPAFDPYDQAAQIGPNGPYFQSQRLPIYRRYIDRLLESGRAYKDFKSAEDLDAERWAAKAAGKAYRYDPTEALSLSDEQVRHYEAEGRPFVIRFRQVEAVGFEDEVFGPVRHEREELEDFVIQKADGYPTFHLAVVVDDAEMGVTHVIRGQEHLNNTPKHVALQDALGLPRPVYAHTPSILNLDSGSKMSKRDKAKTARDAAKQWMKNQGDESGERLLGQILSGTVNRLSAEELQGFIDKQSDDVGIAAAIAEALDVKLPEIDVADFRASGYLPEVLLNYISLLGWSPGEDREQFDLDFLVAHFDLKRIGKANARFDREKLFRFNSDAMQRLSPMQFRERFAEHCQRFAPEFLEKLSPEQFALLAESYRERTRVFKEATENGRFFIEPADRIQYDAKAVKKVLQKNDGEGFSVLRDLQPRLSGLERWDTQTLEATLSDYAQRRELGLGKIAQPLRVAVSGSTVSPPIYDTLVILGRQSTLERVERCLQQQAEAAT